VKIDLRPIGVIHTPFKTQEETPIQPFRSQEEGRVEVFREFEEGLLDIEHFSHIILLYHFHQIKEEKLIVKPFLDKKLHGVFATRYPFRPNHIGLSVVDLLRREGNILVVKHIDVLDGAPLIDIKPYVTVFDRKDDVRNGWVEGKT